MNKVITEEELLATNVTEAEVDDTLEYIQAKQDDEMAQEIQQGLQLGDSDGISHPFYVEELGLCLLAKNFKECPVFEESKLYRIKKNKLINALNTAGANVPKRLNKEEIGKRLVNFIEKNCDCLKFV